MFHLVHFTRDVVYPIRAAFSIAGRYYFIWCCLRIADSCGEGEGEDRGEGIKSC